MIQLIVDARPERGLTWINRSDARSAGAGGLSV
jgi:hypothetical protein